MNTMYVLHMNNDNNNIRKWRASHQGMMMTEDDVYVKIVIGDNIVHKLIWHN